MCARCKEVPRVTQSYCRKCVNELAAESRLRTRPRERFEERQCLVCGTTFMWRSTHGKQKHCSKTCYMKTREREVLRLEREAINAARRAAGEKVKYIRKPPKPEGDLQWCGGHQEWLATELFSPGTKKACRECSAKYSNDYKEKTGPEVRKSQYRRSAYLKRLRKYGITEDQHISMRIEQDDLCAICLEPQKPSKVAQELVIDHCHETGRVRGLLCSTCNISLGGFRDSPDLLLSAVAYLSR